MCKRGVNWDVLHQRAKPPPTKASKGEGGEGSERERPEGHSLNVGRDEGSKVTLEGA